MKKNRFNHKKIKKGAAGYLDYQKKAEILRTVIYFAIIIAIFALGYSQTHSNKNLLTVVAVVGCLPASKALVGVIMRIPHRSIATDKAREIREKGSRLTVIYDLVLTSNDKIMPIECFAIAGDKIFGYAPNEKVDETYVAKHIQKILAENGFSGVSVRILHQYTAFLSRVEGLDNIAAVEKSDTKEYEQKIANVILNISL